MSEAAAPCCSWYSDESLGGKTEEASVAAGAALAVGWAKGCAPSVGATDEWPTEAAAHAASNNPGELSVGANGGRLQASSGGATVAGDDEAGV